MSKDKAVKKTKTPVTKRNARKTPSKNSKKDLNDVKTKTPAKSKSEKAALNKKTPRRGIKSKDLVETEDEEETQEVNFDKGTPEETQEENEKTPNMEVVQSEQNVSPKEEEEPKEVENQLVEIPSEDKVEEESIDLNETIIPPEAIENIPTEESESVWSKIKSKLSNVLSNLFSYITPSKESEDSNNDSNDNKFDPNITIIDPAELEELEKEEKEMEKEKLEEDEEENKQIKENKSEEEKEKLEENIPSLPTPPEINNNNSNNNDNNMHILLNITNDNDEDGNNSGVILYQHIPENEINNNNNNNTQSTQQEVEGKKDTQIEQFDKEIENESEKEEKVKEDDKKENEKINIKLFNFQTTSTPSYYLNMEQPPNLMKRKRFQLHINKNKSNKPIQSEKRYFKLKYIPYTNIIAVPPSKMIKTIAIEKDEEISKSSKVIKPNIIESKQINNLSFSLSPPKTSLKSSSSSDKSKLNFDLTKDTKKIFTTLDKLTTPSRIYSQYNNGNDNEEEMNNKSNIDFSYVNKDINDSMSILSEKINEATDYVKKRNSLSVFDSLNNSITANKTVEIDSPFSTHDVGEYSFSSPTPSKIIVGSDVNISKEFTFSNPNISKINNDDNNDNNDNDDEFSFSLPKNVPRLEPDDSNYVFATAL